MTDKFIVVNSKEESEKAAKYLESLGYSLSWCYEESFYEDETLTLSTMGEEYYFSRYSASFHAVEFQEEELFVPEEFKLKQIRGNTLTKLAQCFNFGL